MTDPIDHVVVLILENRSFDQMLGCFHPQVDGVDPRAPAVNRDSAGRDYFQLPTTVRQMLLDPHHEVGHVATQLEGGNGGFVRDFETCYGASTSDERQLIMSYYERGFLPALHALAEDFTICDRWFSSLPGPTWPNRFFALTGTSNGRIDMPGDGEHTVDPAGWFEQDQMTIFDNLTEHGIHWKCYFHDVPQSAVLCHQRRPENAARYFYIDEFYEDARGRAEDFPQFCLIEPDFNGIGENDDHPPHDVMKAEKLVANVYNALRANAPLWQSTLLVVFCDEHGGFYDHVVPPSAVPPDDRAYGYDFKQLGLRVPALLISPWVDRRTDSTQFDHTSVLRYLIDKWDLEPMGRRAAAANSIAAALTRATPRALTDTVPWIELSQDQLAAPNPEVEEKAFGDSVHHKALQALRAYLVAETVGLLPRLFVPLARGYVFAKRGLDWLLDRLHVLHVSVADLDKVTTLRTGVRGDFARFLRSHKKRSVKTLSRIIRNTAADPQRRDHAVHTLAMVSNRPFHRRPARVQLATEWLDRHGQ